MSESPEARPAVLLTGARVVDPSQQLDGPAEILLRDGKIVALGESLSAEDRAKGAERIELDGRVVVPGLVEGRANLGEPGFETRETLRTGLSAALAGGFTAVVCLPDSAPANDQRSITELLLRQSEALGLARLYPMAALSKGLEGEQLTEMGELSQAGAVAVGDADRPVKNGALLRRALLYARHFDLPVVHRARDPELAADGVMHEGEWSTRLGLPGEPALAEEAMLARDLLLTAETGGRCHLATLSTAGALDQLRRAKARGLAVSCEVATAHLLLHDAAVFESGFSTATRLDPPLRSSADVDALLVGLADGTIDAIVSDHRPCHADDKEDVQFSIAPPGIVGLETTLSLCLDRLVGRGVIGLSRLVELLSCGPARIYGLPGGTLAPGSPADLTVLDLEKEVTVDPTRFRSLGRSTPFAGWTLRGAAVETWVGGHRHSIVQEADR